MKKVIAALAAAVLLISLVSMVFAAQSKKGTIKSVDQKAGTVVFCPKGTTQDMTLKADKSVDLSKVKAGEKVEVTVENDTMMKVKKARRMPAIGC